MRTAWWNRVAAGLLCLLVLAWVAWLWHMRKTPADYVIDAARRAPPVPMCQWVAVDSPEISSLGLSRAIPPAWTDSRQALVAFRTAGGQPWYVDVGVVAVAGTGVSISVDGDAARSIATQPLPRGKVVRLPLSLHAADGVHLLTINVAEARPPRGHDQRWLGVAISRINVCDSLTNAGV